MRSILILISLVSGSAMHGQGHFYSATQEAALRRYSSKQRDPRWLSALSGYKVTKRVIFFRFGPRKVVIYRVQSIDQDQLSDLLVKPLHRSGYDGPAHPQSQSQFGKPRENLLIMNLRNGRDSIIVDDVYISLPEARRLKRHLGFDPFVKDPSTIDYDNWAPEQ